VTRPLARIRLKELSPAQISALLLGACGTLRRTAGIWSVRGVEGHISDRTFNVMVRHGLFRTRAAAGNTQTVGDLTLQGYALADLAVTLSREISRALAGLPSVSIARLAAVDDEEALAVHGGQKAEQTGAAEQQDAGIAGRIDEECHANGGEAQHTAACAERSDAHLLLDGGNLAFLDRGVDGWLGRTADATDGVKPDTQDGDHRQRGSGQQQRVIDRHRPLPAPNTTNDCA
jgi:hypothetical protein